MSHPDGSDPDHSSDNPSGQAKVQHITRTPTSSRIYGTLQNTSLVETPNLQPGVEYYYDNLVLLMQDPFSRCFRCGVLAQSKTSERNNGPDDESPTSNQHALVHSSWPSAIISFVPFFFLFKYPLLQSYPLLCFRKYHGQDMLL